MSTATAPETSVDQDPFEAAQRFRVPLDKIVVKRKRSIDAKDEKNVAFIDSIRRVGVLQPVELRACTNGTFELVFGHRRVWAAKRIGLKDIPANVSVWTDDQVAFVALAENTHRQQLTATQYAEHVKLLLREIEKSFGPDPGRAVGGIKRSAKAKRETGSNQFAKSDDAPAEAENLGEKPATNSEFVAGSEASLPEEEPIRTHRKILAESTGRSDQRAGDDILIAKTLSEEELTSLHGDSVTKAHLIRLCKEFKNATEREIAIGNIIIGMDPDEAIDAAKRELVAPSEQELARQAYLKEEKTKDSAWLKEYCSAVRDKLQDPSFFDDDAVLYRITRDARTVVKTAAKRAVVKARQNGRRSPIVTLIGKVCWIEHPSSWTICRYCKGQNKDQPNCDGCGGVGYLPRITIPTALRAADLPEDDL